MSTRQAVPILALPILEPFGKGPQSRRAARRCQFWHWQPATLWWYPIFDRKRSSSLTLKGADDPLTLKGADDPLTLKGADDQGGAK